MKRILLLGTLICLFMANSMAQSASTTQTYMHKKYIGMRGGYLFKNKYANTNPMWHLKNGNFLEVDFGTRSNNGILGFGASIGYLTIARDKPKWQSGEINRQMIYDSITGGTRPTITTGLNTNPIPWGAQNITEQYSKKFRGLYVLAGPEIWLGDGAFKVNAYLQGGISLNKVGYYYVEGDKRISDLANVILTGPFGSVSTRNYLMSGDINFAQFGMSNKYYNKILASAPPSNAAAFAIKEDGELSFMARAGISAEYFVTQKISVHAGASYWYIGVPKMKGGRVGSGNINYSTNPGSLPAGNASFQFEDYSYKTKNNLGYVSANLGIKYWWGRNNNKTKTPRAPRAPKQAKCCGTCPVYGLAVTARDKYTKEILPNTDVAIKNKAGEVVKTGKTNAFGVIVFDKIVKDDYTISGLLNNIALENGSVNSDELICDKVVQKEVIYADRNFIIKGKAFECNSNTPIPGINVTLENIDMAYKKSTMTDNEGNFLIQLPETGTYSLYARKANYLSQVEEVTASNYNRDKNLFVKLEICAQKADCGKAINLQNILFDLDKYAIKEQAKKELNRLVRFMQDNPGVKVELSSHTDCRNTDTYNQTLSQNRANASVDYVVSQGISRDRLVGKGYGESKLLNRCADGVNCSEAEHSINRRTEMKVICPE